MTKARRERLKEAWKWFPEQGFKDDSHIVKEYRVRFTWEEARQEGLIEED